MSRKRIALDQLESHWISTVKLGHEIEPIDKTIDLLSMVIGVDRPAGPSSGGPYETLVFPGQEGDAGLLIEVDGERYHTEDEAKAGHTRFVTKYREAESCSNGK